MGRGHFGDRRREGGQSVMGGDTAGWEGTVGVEGDRWGQKGHYGVGGDMGGDSYRAALGRGHQEGTLWDRRGHFGVRRMG